MLFFISRHNIGYLYFITNETHYLVMGIRVPSGVYTTGTIPNASQTLDCLGSQPYFRILQLRQLGD